MKLARSFQSPSRRLPFCCLYVSYCWRTARNFAMTASRVSVGGGGGAWVVFVTCAGSCLWLACGCVFDVVAPSRGGVTTGGVTTGGATGGWIGSTFTAVGGCVGLPGGDCSSGGISSTLIVDA